jgi:hypothetical protein
MSELTAKETIAAIADPIHTIGSNIFLSPETFSRAAEAGWPNPFSFYFAGRGGMLGEVSPSVVVAALGWFNPDAAAAMYQEGVATHGAAGAAATMLEAHAQWGRDHYSSLEGIERAVELAELLVDNAEGAGLPLFVAWRARPRVEDAPGRAAQLFQMLREWRGGVHLVATTAVGLSPLEAILTNEGEGQAKFFGWSEPFIDVTSKKGLHDEAEEITNRLCERDVESALNGSQRAEFADLVKVALALS